MPRETKQFDELAQIIMQDSDTISARVVKDAEGNAAPLFVAHMYMDGREYVLSVIPTDLEPTQ